jgi:hypothetical protein
MGAEGKDKTATKAAKDRTGKNPTSNSCKSSPSYASQVLISGIKPRSKLAGGRRQSGNGQQQHQQQQGQFYYVLGWSWSYYSPYSSKNDIASKDNSNSKLHKVTILAGLLDASSSPTSSMLDLYRSRIQQVKDKITELGGCSMLTSDLDIVARFSCSSSSSSSSRENEDRTISIPVIDDKNGYIWWKSSSSTQEDQTEDDDAFDCKINSVSQIMNFSLNKSSRYAHFNTSAFTPVSNAEGRRSPESSRNSQWSLILHRINHCDEIVDLIAKPHFNDELLSRQQPPYAQSLMEQDSFSSNHQMDETFFLRSIFQHSTFMLHLSSHLQIQPDQSPSLSKILSISPMYRTIKDIQRLSLKYPNDISTHFCDCCSKPTFTVVTSRSRLVKQTTDRWNLFFSSLIDTVIGWLICVLLIILIRYHFFQQQKPGFPILNWYLWFKQTTTITKLVEQLAWLESFPTGFKLNGPLTQHLGDQIRYLLHYQEHILLATTWDPNIFGAVILPTLAFLAAFGGASMFLSAFIDLWRVEMIHFVILATLFRRLYQTELYLLSALFRLFRGKKYNPLRRRTDSNKYDAMQLMVGTIAFCVCIFLWTTLWYYYSFFCLWNIISHIPIAAIWMSYVLIPCIPWGSLFWWSAHPDWFPKEHFLKFASSPEPHLQISKLCSTLQSPMKFFDHTVSQVHGLMKWFLSSALGALLPQLSDPSSPCTLPISTYMRTLYTWGMPTSKATTHGKKDQRITSRTSKGKQKYE